MLGTRKKYTENTPNGGKGAFWVRLSVYFSVALLLWGGSGQELSAAEVSPEPLRIETSGGVHAFTVELALNDQQRALGLMNRTELPPDAGMLFVWPDVQVIRMWMRNTLIPLDMLYIDAEGRIVHIEHQAQPHDLTPRGPSTPVLAVLEIAGGEAERRGISVSDRVGHPVLSQAASRR